MNGQDMKQFLDGIAEQAVKARALDIIPLPGNREYLVFDRTTGTTSRDAVPPRRHCESLESPTAMAHFVEAGSHNDTGTEAAIFLNEDRVELVYNLEDGRDLSVCKLIPSPQLTWLRASGGKPRTQLDFIRDLRITFAGCIDAGITALVRNLKFSVAKEGYASVQQGRESMGRSVLAEVRGEAAIPEDVTLTIPLFENYGKPYAILCALDVNAQSETFTLTPLPLALRGAMDACLGSIAILYDDIPVFFGDSGRE